MDENQTDRTVENRPQVKICGLTDPQTAAACAALGADAIGCVFYPKSPRNVTAEQARTIVRALPAHVKSAGVFVNAAYDEIMRIVDHAGLRIAQLHGQESPELAARLAANGLIVIKALFMTRPPFPEQAPDFSVHAYLVECGKGLLPGGNAMTWNWQDTRAFGEDHPLILAGGLTPENIKDAFSAAMPDGVDISSGVESAPGQKDVKKVQAFFHNLQRCRSDRIVRKVL